ncbi:MAG: hypothetical protein FWE63_01935 [Bacteroidales bacterium]|nr:hypothetical protein [Bacteroidales bacterium]
MKHQTRLKITFIIVAIITTFGVVGLFRSMENLAITVVGSLMTSLGLYVWAQTARPTNQHSNESNDK